MPTYQMHTYDCRYWKIYYLIRAPIFWLLVLTVPIVDYEEEDHRWNRPLNTMHCIFGLLGFAFASELGAWCSAARFFKLVLMVPCV